MEDDILCGGAAQIPPEDERCVRVFLCAEPLDSLKEREALRSAVYPELREYCRRLHGLEFQLIDGYDGVHPSEFYDSRVRKIRMELLEKCLRSPVGPCFVALIGEEYGRPGLPTQIGTEEFENILHVAGERKVCAEALERWYMRDENATPPVYNLLDKEEGRSGCSDPAEDPLGNIRAVFDAVVPACVETGLLKPQQADKYFNSALEEEFLFALQNRPAGLLEKCICYIHRIPYRAILKQRERWESAGRPSGTEKLRHIRDTLIPSLARAGGLHVYSATTTCDVKVGYTEEKRRQYVAGLCRQFYGDVVKVIQRSCPPYPPRWKRAITEEASQHLSLCAMFADLQQYEAKEAEGIEDYVVRDASRRPLVVFGEPGCGKTVLLASCAKKVHSWLRASDPVLIVRFVPAFGEAVALRGLLTGLCQQLADIYRARHLSHRGDTEGLRERFADALSAASEERPLVLILDAVDRLGPAGNAEDFRWLPDPIPPFAKVILSVTRKENTADCDPVKTFGQRRVRLLRVKPSRKECNEGLKRALTEHHRKITSGQQMFVNRSLESNASPLQMTMVLKEVAEWKSHQEIDGRSLGGNTYGIVKRFFQNLEVKYGLAVLSRAVGYVTLSRSGVNEAELVDLMSSDDAVLAQLYRLHDNVGTLRVPDWLVASLLHDLNGCLSRRTVTGFRLLCWTNGIYRKVTHSRYLSSPEVVHKLHANMAHYFSGRWACGRSKPISVRTRNERDEGADVNWAAAGPPAKVYVDCQLPSQPWFFATESKNRAAGTGNVRKAHELPFHLMECGRLENLFNDVVLAAPYHKVLLKAGLLRLLFQSMEEAAALINREEVCLILDSLKEASCVLNENPDSMEFVLQSKMAPLASTYPSLWSFVRQLYREATRRSPCVVVSSSPLIKVCLAKAQFRETSRVVGVLESEAKPSVTIVFENGGVCSWGTEDKLTPEYRLSGGASVKHSVMEPDGRYLALVTDDHVFTILDCSSWTLLCTIKSILRGNHQEAELIPKAFHLTGSSLLVCYNDSPIVRIYKVHSGAIVKEIVFPQEVTFFGYESSNEYTILGQTNRILIYGSKNFDLKFDLSVDRLAHPIGEVYIQGRLVYVIDRAGDIMVWSTEDPTEPQLMDEIYTNEEKDEMMSSEMATRWLLICRSKTIDVWNVSTWEKVRFKPPKDTRFLCCAFSEGCGEIIAAAEGGSSIFVWDRESGQCLSVIRQEYGEFALFAKFPQLGSLIAATTDRFLLRWDLKSVVATSLSQTGRSIVSLLLCPRGSAAFTSDGSEMVCEWDISCSKIRTCFLHNDLVDIMTLTATGELLVTSVASGGLYIWVTESGENVQYIQCSPASRMLITPSTSVMVCMCQDGPTRVWNPATGNIVCSIHVRLNQAVVTPDGTFLIGLNDEGKLLAVSLWSGRVCKQFRRDTHPAGSIEAFQYLRSHPDFVAVLTSSAELYTWHVVEETVCLQVKLPIDLSHPRRLFEVSSSGGVAVVTVNKTVHVFNTQDGKLGVHYVPNTILQQQLTSDGRYFLYTCHPKQNDCGCEFHANPVLNVMKVIDGEKVGQYPLGKTPSAMTVAEDGSAICIGFEDGTVGLYSLVDASEGHTRVGGPISSSTNKGDTRNVPVQIHRHKQSPDVVWSSSTKEAYDSDSRSCDLNINT